MDELFLRQHKPVIIVTKQKKKLIKMISCKTQSNLFSTCFFPKQTPDIKSIIKNTVLTVEAEGDVDGLLLCEALGIGEPGTLELGGSRRVTHVDPAHGLLGVYEVHSSGLLSVDGDGVSSAQGGGLDVLGVGYEEVRMPIYRVLKRDEKTW